MMHTKLINLGRKSLSYNLSNNHLEKSIFFSLYLNTGITLDVTIESGNVFLIGIILLQKEYFNMLVFANWDAILLLGTRILTEWPLA